MESSEEIKRRMAELYVAYEERKLAIQQVCPHEHSYVQLSPPMRICSDCDKQLPIVPAETET